MAQEASREEHDWEAGAEAVGGRIFLCEPGEAWFGELASRRVYRLKLMLLNKSPFLAKFRIRQVRSVFASARRPVMCVCACVFCARAVCVKRFAALAWLASRAIA